MTSRTSRPTTRPWASSPNSGVSTRPGESHGARLIGERLVGDLHKPIELLEFPDGSLESYSEVLSLEERVWGMT